MGTSFGIRVEDALGHGGGARPGDAPASTTSQPMTTTIRAEMSSMPHGERSVALSTGSRTIAWPPMPGFITLVSTNDQSAV